MRTSGEDTSEISHEMTWTLLRTGVAQNNTVIKNYIRAKIDNVPRIEGVDYELIKIN